MVDKSAITVYSNGKKHLLKAGSTVLDFLALGKHSRQTSVVKVNGKVCPESAVLETGDRIEVIKVVFGG